MDKRYERMPLKNLGLALICSIGLVACGDSGEPASKTVKSGNRDLVHSVEVIEDRYYDCFAYDASYRGGIDCQRIQLPENGELPTLNPNPDVVVSSESVDGRNLDCFAYDASYRNGVSCSPA